MVILEGWVFLMSEVPLLQDSDEGQYLQMQTVRPSVSSRIGWNGGVPSEKVRDPPSQSWDHSAPARSRNKRNIEFCRSILGPLGSSSSQHRRTPEIVL